MSLHELDISWVTTAGGRRDLRWELLACADVQGVFASDRADVLVVLFNGSRRRFRNWARSVAPPVPVYPKGALQ